MDLLAALKQKPIIKMAISDYCTAEVDAPVEDVVGEMNAKHCHSALILRNGKLAGIFTDRDIMMKIANNPSTLMRPVSDFMTPDPITLPKTATPAEALAIMKRNHLRNVPVVEENGSVLGNFTHFSVLDLIADAFPNVDIERYAFPTRFSRYRHGG